MIQNVIVYAYSIISISSRVRSTIKACSASFLIVISAFNKRVHSFSFSYSLLIKGIATYLSLRSRSRSFRDLNRRCSHFVQLSIVIVDSGCVDSVECVLLQLEPMSTDRQCKLCLKLEENNGYLYDHLHDWNWLREFSDILTQITAGTEKPFDHQQFQKLIVRNNHLLHAQKCIEAREFVCFQCPSVIDLYIKFKQQNDELRAELDEVWTQIRREKRRINKLRKKLDERNQVTLLD